jgi:hypothetical protein
VKLPEDARPTIERFKGAGGGEPLETIRELKGRSGATFVRLRLALTGRDAGPSSGRSSRRCRARRL